MWFCDWEQQIVTGRICANFQINNRGYIPFCVQLGKLPTLTTLEGTYRELITHFNTDLREDGKIKFPYDF